MIEQWFSDPSRVGATVLLMTAIVAYHRGWIVARWQYDKLETQCKLERDARERVLNRFEQSLDVAAVATQTAKKAIGHK